MSYEANLTTVSLPAGADLSADQYKAVKLNSSSQVVLCDTAGEEVFGILQNAPDAAGKVAEVATDGVTKWRAGGALATPGTRLKTDTTGRAAATSASVVNTNDGGSTTDPVIGSNTFAIQLEAATAAGDRIAVLIARQGAVPTTAA